MSDLRSGSRSRVSRRFVLGGLLAGVAAPALGNAPLTSPRPVTRPNAGAGAPPRATVRPIEAIVEGARVSGRVSFAVADARSGELLEGYDPDLAQPPASSLKALTAQYALESLGSRYSFVTRLLATGPIEGGRLNGDLVLAGGGDPVLQTDELGDLAAALARAGVREVAGRFLYTAGPLPYIEAIDPGQMEHVGYNPSVAGLNLNYNRVFFEWKPNGTGYDVTMEARGERYRPRVVLSRMEVVDRSSPVYTYSSTGGRDNWTVARSALGNGGGRWLPVRRPDAYVAEVFHTIARALDVVLPAPEPARGAVRGQVIVEHRSDDLGEILREMLRFSNNLTAEAVGLAATDARGSTPRDLAASAAAMAGWAGQRYGLGQTRFVDHSGLGGGSRISAAQFCRFLAGAGPDGALRGLMRDFQMRDGRGNPVPNHPVRVRAKTGTLNFVSALGGHVATPGGRDLVFAVFAADLPRRQALAPHERERPAGNSAWLTRARALQQELIVRWAGLFDA